MQDLTPFALVGEENTVRVIDVFIEELNLVEMGVKGLTLKATGRPKYHPATLLKLYLYGYLNRIQSSRRLETECQRNIQSGSNPLNFIMYPTAMSEQRSLIKLLLACKM
jgi:transposase